MLYDSSVRKAFGTLTLSPSSQIRGNLLLNKHNTWAILLWRKELHLFIYLFVWKGQLPWANSGPVLFHSCGLHINPVIALFRAPECWEFVATVYLMYQRTLTLELLLVWRDHANPEHFHHCPCLKQVQVPFWHGFLFSRSCLQLWPWGSRH